ncbi:MAG: sigma-70 family polymerase sigma factor [Gammaproteobacteria bacterium]|nr:sigma-70 family polymerase sigma factor [Gammaproteobacteria bacterium]
MLYATKVPVRVPEADWIALVESIATGDQLALHDLYERTHRLVFTLIMRITRSRETAEELTLDVFHDLWRRAAKYDAAAGTVLGWIMNQARSRAIDHLRYVQRKKRVNPYAHGAVVDAADIGSDEVFDSGEQARLKTTLAVLTAGEREAIEAAFFSELTYAEVAAELGQPLGTVKTRIRSALRKLRHALSTGVNER